MWFLRTDYSFTFLHITALFLEHLTIPNYVVCGWSEVYCLIGVGFMYRSVQLMYQICLKACTMLNMVCSGLAFWLRRCRKVEISQHFLIIKISKIRSALLMHVWCNCKASSNSQCCIWLFLDDGWTQVETCLKEYCKKYKRGLIHPSCVVWCFSTYHILVNLVGSMFTSYVLIGKWQVRSFWITDIKRCL